MAISFGRRRPYQNLNNTIDTANVGQCAPSSDTLSKIRTFIGQVEIFFFTQEKSFCKLQIEFYFFKLFQFSNCELFFSVLVRDFFSFSSPFF